MTVVAPALGVVLVVVAAWDIMLTLLHPTARGPFSHAANRTTWKAVRSVSRRVLAGRGLSFAGPLAVAVNVVTWVVALWIGYALIYLPFVGSFSYDPPQAFAGPGLPDALYLSGAALTTVGFGDVVATGDPLRLVTAIEAASGFGVLSASIAFVLSIYPLMSQLRSTGIRLADLGALELRGAARVVRDAGASELSAIIRELTENHEHLRRFPVLYYFESGNREESLSASVRASSLLLIALRSDDGARLAHAPVYAEVLEKLIARLLDDLERDFVGGRRRPASSQDSEGDGDGRGAALSAGLPPGRPGEPEVDSDRAQVVALLARAERVLEAVAEEHGHQARPLLAQTAGTSHRVDHAGRG